MRPRKARSVPRATGLRAGERAIRRGKIDTGRAARSLTQVDHGQVDVRPRRPDVRSSGRGPEIGARCSRLIGSEGAVDPTGGRPGCRRYGSPNRGSLRGMKKVEAIVKPSGVDNVAERLRHIGVEGLTVSEIELVDLVPKVRLQIVVNDEMVEQVVAAIRG